MIEIPLFNEFSLKMSDTPLGKMEYPTAFLQKGLILLDRGQELDEEGVGFGVPLLKRGLNTIFPGSVELTTQQEGSTFVILAKFRLNLEEKISTGKTEVVKNRLLYIVKNLLAAMIRRLPILRRLLTSTSSRLRKIFNWETTYSLSDFSDVIEIEYSISVGTGQIAVKVDASNIRPDITEVVVMNEQGARPFDKYIDTAGIEIEGEKIGCWDEVHAHKARFMSSKHKISFELSQIESTRLFRGRELVDQRLAWAGFGYSFPPSVKKIQYRIQIEPIP